MKDKFMPERRKNMANEKKMNNGNENQEPQVEVVKKENVFKKAWNGVKAFPTNHPRIWKGIKITGCALGAAGIGAGAYALGKNAGQKSVDAVDATDVFQPVVDDIPVLPEPESIPFEEIIDNVSDAVESAVEA